MTLSLSMETFHCPCVIYWFYLHYDMLVLKIGKPQETLAVWFTFLVGGSWWFFLISGSTDYPAATSEKQRMSLLWKKHLKGKECQVVWEWELTTGNNSAKQRAMGGEEATFHKLQSRRESHKLIIVCEQWGSEIMKGFRPGMTDHLCHHQQVTRPFIQQPLDSGQRRH